MKENITKLISANPFKPFGIHLSGQVIFIDKPERVAISPTREEVIAFTDDGNYHLINVVQITDLEVSGA